MCSLHKPCVLQSLCVSNCHPYFFTIMLDIFGWLACLLAIAIVHKRRTFYCKFHSGDEKPQQPLLRASKTKQGRLEHPQMKLRRGGWAEPPMNSRQTNACTYMYVHIYMETAAHAHAQVRTQGKKLACFHKTSHHVLDVPHVKAFEKDFQMWGKLWDSQFLLTRIWNSPFG